MKFNKAYKLRLYPNQKQDKILKQMAGNTRFLWNHLLYLNQEKYKSDKKFIFHKEMSASLPSLKIEFSFLKESPATSLQQVTRYLDRALRQSFKKSKGFPQFKKKSLMKDSFYLSNQNFKIFDRKIKLSKLGLVKFRSGDLPKNPEKIMSATISQDGDHWYCSISVEFEKEILAPKLDNIVGIDLGLKSLMTTSDGEVIENPRYLKKSEKKLRKAQRKLSRVKHKFKSRSNNQQKKRLKLYRIHRKVRNQREDFIHKLTTELIANNSVICLEDLDVKGMMKNHRLAKSISDVGWGEIVRQLQYKAEWVGKHVVKIDRFAPSSQACSSCGSKKKLTLSDRTYKCSCGLNVDRDLNAAINIKNWGLELLNNNRDSESRIYACG